ncbi:hypothetical protein AVEN_2538-1 [Araneus ventricosus]|uniref:Uncharacterized protein n=1 Tax=Araneus ventricosus TaxID=182803 RepID=A0A4Y2QHW4_ARAVE|nr:hypothetical protein AVEN_2538-1 [Araneus ventricosus]
MSCCRISKQELASPVMVGLWVPLPVIVRTSFREGSGRGQVIDYWDSGLSTRSYCSGCHSESRMIRVILRDSAYLWKRYSFRKKEGGSLNKYRQKTWSTKKGVVIKKLKFDFCKNLKIPNS